MPGRQTIPPAVWTWMFRSATLRSPRSPGVRHHPFAPDDPPNAGRRRQHSRVRL